MLRFSASVGFRLLWWMKNLHLSFKTLQVPLRSPCNLHSSFTINVQLDSLRCSKTLAMIIFLNCDNGIGQVSKFTCQPSKRMQRSFNYIHSSISKAQKWKFSWICIILASSLYCYLSVHFNITLSLLLLMALRLWGLYFLVECLLRSLIFLWCFERYLLILKEWCHLGLKPVQFFCLKVVLLFL